jgi:flagellar motor switch protein FliM
MTRAAEWAAGLALTVPSLSEDQMALDDLMSLVPADMMLIALTADGRTQGFAAIDLELRTALIETQTMGRLRPAPADPRPITATDAAMAQPLLTALLAELDHGPALDGWVTGFQPATPLQGKRAAEQALADGTYRLIRMSVDLGAGDRQGQIMLATAVPAPVTAPSAESPNFAAALRQNVLATEAELNAVLHRLQIPLTMAEGLAVGQILPLSGVTVSSVRLEAVDGQVVGRARLGQTAGQRAVRIESGPMAALQDIALSVPALPAI